MTPLTEEIRREVGQHFVFGFYGTKPSEEIKTLIQDYHVGNVILMKRNVKSARQTRELVQVLQQLAKESGHVKPLLIGIDQENGLVSAFSSPTAGTQFPGAMALAATGSSDLAEKVSAASAAELKMAGINWVYSPVADVNTDTKNPVIGVRSFGEDPNKVATFANAVSRGLSSAGVMPTGKHFPGHGDTHVDSHLALPVILKTKEELKQEELIPFKSLIDSDIQCIMTGHMALPLITGSNTPCSLSRDITTTLLRDELGFHGMVVTDCLEMDAIAEPAQGGCGVKEGALRAVQAGADVVMICHTFQRQKEAVERVYEAIEQGHVDVEDLKESGKRITLMKVVFAGEWRQCISTEPGWDARYSDVHARNLDLSREVYSKTTTVVWNAGNIIPLNAAASDRLLLLTPKMESVNRAVDTEDGALIGADGMVRNTAGPSYLAMERALERRAEIRHIVYGSEDRALPTLDGLQGVIFVMRNADLKSWQLDYLKRLELRKLGIPVVLVSSCGPYDMDDAGKEYEEWTGYVATYEFTAEGLESAARVIFGSDT